LAGADERSELSVRIETVSDLDPSRFYDETFEDLAEYCRLHQDPRCRRAYLPLIPECAEHDPFNGRVQVCVGEDDQRRFASQFETDVLMSRAAAITIFRPVATLPVNAIFRTSMGSSSGLPASRPQYSEDDLARPLMAARRFGRLHLPEALLPGEKS